MKPETLLKINTRLIWLGAALIAVDCIMLLVGKVQELTLAYRAGFILMIMIIVRYQLLKKYGNAGATRDAVKSWSPGSTKSRRASGDDVA